MRRVRWQARTRSILFVSLVAGLVGYAVLEERLADDPEQDADSEPLDPDGKLRIDSVKPLEVGPGAALTLEVSGLHDGEDDDGEASALSATLGRAAMRILHHTGQRVVVQIPSDVDPGSAKVRISQGDRRSKPYVVQIRSVSRAGVMRDVFGGLALLILGLRTVGRALRAYAGRGVRSRLSRLTGSPLRGGATGTMVGAFTQSTTSAAALVVSLAQAYMVRAREGLPVLLGAQFGTALAGVLLPLAATREALWVISVGVLWVALAENRRNRTAGKIVLGCGLLFYGLRLLRAGFMPLFSDPQVLPYLSSLSGNSATDLLAAASAGAVLCAAFQGPGPVFGLVLSLAQSSGLIGVSQGLAVLCGTACGSAVSSVALGWPYGKRTRTLAAAHMLLGLAMSAGMLLLLPLWVGIAQQVLGTDPAQLDYGKKVLFPNVGLHLALGFLLAQALATGAALAFVPGAIGLGKRFARTSERALERARQSRLSVPPRPASLAIALVHAREALDALRELRTTLDREPTVAAEQAVRDATLAIEALLENPPTSDATGNVAAAAMSALHLVGAVHAAVRIAERALERDERLLAADANALESLHQRIREGLDAVLISLQNHTALSAADAQAREIGLNASEAEARRRLLGQGEDAEGSARYRLWLSELFVAYEVVGNHLYRLHMALVAELDDDLG